MSKEFKNIFWLGYKDGDPLVQIEANHTPQIGDIIHYLCDGTEKNFDYIRDVYKMTEFEGIVVSKWTSLSYKEIVWTVEIKE